MPNVLQLIPNSAFTILFSMQLMKFVYPSIREHHISKIFAVNVGASTLSALCVNFVFYPFYFARVRLAADVGKLSTNDREFKGMMDCFN